MVQILLTKLKAMLRNYLAIAFRNIKKNKSYIAINTFGLGVALACCITSYILLAYNLEFDNYFSHPDTEDLYRVHTHYVPSDQAEAQHLVTPIAMGPTLAADFASIESYSRYGVFNGFVRSGDDSFSEEISFVDQYFTDLIPLNVLKGSAESFTNLNAVILSERTANKLFPDENPLGQVLTMNFENQTEIQFVVEAVVENLPANSSFYLDYLVRVEHLFDIYNLPSNEWGDWHDTSLLLKIPNVKSIGSLEGDMSKYVSLRNEKKEDAKVTKFRLEKFNEAVNDDDVQWSHFNLRISNIPLIIFLTMAGIILLIACFNLTNTSVALAAKRFKEVGVRKVSGASKVQLISQFLLEMIIIVVLALTFGLAVSKYIVREFVDMWDIPYGFMDLDGLNLFIALIILVIVASILAGIYPALISTRLQPVLLLKNQAKVSGNNWFTKSLVTIQFALCTIVLINGIVFTQNTSFQEKIDYGFNYKDVLAVFIQDENQYKVLKARVESNSSVNDVAVTHHQLGMSSYPFPVKIDTSEYQVQHIEVGENFFELMELSLVSGRFLDINLVSDEFGALVVNQTFIDHTGIDDPLSTTVSIRGERRRIIGVVEDHVDNLFRSREKEPFVFYGSKRNEYRVMLIKSDAKNLVAVRDNVEKHWKELYPDRPFQSDFQEELLLSGLRGINENMKKIFMFLTILGALLSVSGIYALSSISVEKRTKEIGIRKTLGGSVNGIVRLLSKQFVVILMISGVIGGTIGYLETGFLLGQIYAYHIDTQLFSVLAGILVVGAAGFFTTTTTVFKAAQADPVKTLRDE